MFVALLVHEATHLPQARAGKTQGYTQSKDNPICIAMEREAFDQQTATLRDLAHAMVGNSSVQKQYEWDLQQLLDSDFTDTLLDAQLDCSPS